MTCQFGHDSHETITAPTDLGPMVVFDTRLYDTDLPGWCPGRHNVCDRLRVEGRWEPHDSNSIRQVLEDGDRSGLVVDFGANVGWYTLMAARLGYSVVAIEGDPDFVDLLRQNVELQGLERLVTIRHDWVDEDYVFVLPDGDVELIKTDLEGSDGYAVEACWGFVDRVNHWYLELSPELGMDCPPIVAKLAEAGFKAWYSDDRLFDGDFSHGQINLRFSRR